MSSLFDWEEEELSPDSPLGIAIENYENKRQLFFKRAERYTFLPTKNNYYKMQVAKGNLVQGFGDYLEFLYLDKVSDDNEKAAIIANFMINEYSMRSELFNNLLGNWDPYEPDSEDREEAVNHFQSIITEDKDEGFESILNAYSRKLNQEIEEFSDEIEFTRHAKFLNLAKEVGKHALIVSDVVVGLYIYEQLTK